MKNFTVPKPCHENWETMLPDDKGKFCSTCVKSVFDFTKMSQEEIWQIYQSNNGKICGRFLPEQLQTSAKRGIDSQKINSPFVRRTSVLTFAASAASVLFALSSCTNKSDAKFNLKEKTKDSQNIFVKDSTVNQMVIGLMLPVNDSTKQVKEPVKKNLKKTAAPPAIPTPVPDHPDFHVTGEPAYVPDSLEQK